jgi:hypothetical protein
MIKVTTTAPTLADVMYEMYTDNDEASEFTEEENWSTHCAYRTISNVILQGRVAITPAQRTLTKNWTRGMEEIGIDVGSVDGIGAARKRQSLDEKFVNTVQEWLNEMNLSSGQNGPLQASDAENVHACRSANFHHDLDGFGEYCFCIVWLGKAAGLELCFPLLNKRIPLRPGTVVVFDSGQPHGVLLKGESLYAASVYEDRPINLFLSIDLYALSPGVANSMDILVAAEPSDGSIVLAQSDNLMPEVDRTTGAWSFPDAPARIGAATPLQQAA